MTKYEKIVVSAYTGVLMCDFDDLHKYIQEKLGRPVWTHELASKAVVQEIENAAKPEFLKLAMGAEPPAAGTPVWVVVREEYMPVRVNGYGFVARVDNRVIVTPVFCWCKNFEEIMASQISETISNGVSRLAVFPAEDCYTSQEAALAALAEEKGV